MTDLFEMYHRSSVQALEDARWCFTHHDLWFFCKDFHGGRRFHGVTDTTEDK